MQQSIEDTLPALRKDLEFEYAGEDIAGRPVWQVKDSVRDKYFRLSYVGYLMLTYWSGKLDIVVERVRKNSVFLLTREDVDKFRKFLIGNCLVEVSDAKSMAVLQYFKIKSQHSLFMKVVHNYLFFRIPLFKPDKFLEKTLPWVRLLVHPVMLYGFAILALLGLYLVAQQFETFTATLQDIFTIKGFLSFAGALIFAKVIHELSHAYVAKSQGCRVPTIGVAFIVMWPVMYTDAGDSWKLRSRRARFMIGAAGMVAELGLAIIALFLWSVTSDGALKSTFFFLATASWVATILVNTNPLMRFDGYYLFQDFIQVDNLQTRAFYFSKWHLRRFLFGIKDIKAEYLPKSQELAVTIFGFSVWVYRFFLFLGIALLVYHHFFKALGIILFMVEIIWFLTLPILNEVIAWWKMRDKMRLNLPTIRTLVFTFFLLGFLFFPWKQNVNLSGLVQPQDSVQIFIPSAGRVVKTPVKRGDSIEKGQAVFIIESPELDNKIRFARLEAESIDIQLQRVGSDRKASREKLVYEEKWQAAALEYNTLLDEKENLSPIAEISGVITMLDDNIKPGVWVSESLPVGRIATTDDLEVVGYVTEKSRHLLQKGDKGRFYPDGLDHKPFSVKLIAIEDTNTDVLTDYSLASINGGKIAVRPQKDGRLIPEDSIYRVYLAVSDKKYSRLLIDREIRGVIQLKGNRKSHFSSIWNEVLKVFIRETSF